MNSIDMTEFYTILKEMEEQTLKALHKSNESLMFQSSYGDKDEFLTSTMNDLLLSQKSKNLKKLNEIKRALKKIENNTYGLCEKTNKPINVKRLKANPLARYNIEEATAQSEEIEYHKLH